MVGCSSHMLYISPPFGNYLSYKDSVQVKGTFTWERRKGIIRRSLKTIRPVSGGWRNSIGFRNPGIRSVTFRPETTYSVSIIESYEWELLYDFLPEGIDLEINLSCPNVPSVSIPVSILRPFLEKFPTLTLKTSPVIPQKELQKYAELGVRNFHMSNTIPSPEGGISGKQLKKINLPLIENAASSLSGVRLIAGGGIYSVQDVIDYRNAGANDFSVSTVWFSCPWNIPAIYKEAICE